MLFNALVLYVYFCKAYFRMNVDIQKNYSLLSVI